MTAKIEAGPGESPQALSVLNAWLRAGAPMVGQDGQQFQLITSRSGRLVVSTDDVTGCQPVASTMVLLDHGAVLEQERTPYEGEPDYLDGDEEGDYGERYDDVGEPPGALIGWTREEHGHG